MPVDARIALGYQPPQIESPMNRLGRFMELESAQRQNALYERQQAELMRKQQQEAAINAAYSNALTLEGRLDEGKLSNYLAQAGAGSAIPGAMEALGKGREAQLKARDAELAQARANYSTYNRAMLAVANRPDLTKDMAASTARALAAAGIVNPDIVEQGIAQMGDDPKQLRAAILSSARQTMTDEQMKSVFSTPLEFRSLGGGVGGFDPYSGELIRATPNIPEPDVVVRQKERVAAAGAPPPTPGQKRFSEVIGGKAAEQLDNLYTQAQSAESRLSLSEQLQPLLDNPEFISGTLGDARLAVAKMLGMEGAEETQAYFAGIGGQVAEIIKAFGAGTGLSDADRKFAEKIAGGSIELTPGAIRRIVRLNNDAAKLVISRYNRRRGELMREEQEVGRFYPEVQPPSSGVVQVNTVEEARALPPGTRFKTPDGRIKVR